MKKCLSLLLAVCMALSLLPVFAAAVDETDFTPVKITVSAIGSTTDGYKRFVISTADFPFTVSAENQLKGCLLNGTISYTGADTHIYTGTVTFEDVGIVASDVRSGSKSAIDFVAPANSRINEAAGDYTFDLTISPAKTVVDETNFIPFKLSVQRTGEASGKRILVSAADFPFTPGDGQLVGCLLNGTVLYNGAANYSKTVPFVNVAIAAQPVRTDGYIALDFKVPDGYTICMSETEDSNYVWDLTLSPAAELKIEKAVYADSKVSVTFNNETLGTITDVILLVAVYNEEGMADVHMQDITSIAGASTQTVDGITFETSDWTYGKVLLWKSFETMQPVLAAVDIEIQ